MFVTADVTADVTALQTVAVEQRVQHASVVTVFSSMFSAVLSKAKVNVWHQHKSSRLVWVAALPLAVRLTSDIVAQLVYGLKQVLALEEAPKPL